MNQFMMKTASKFVFTFIAVFLLGNAHAVDIGSLCKVRVPIESYSAEARSEAFPEALKRVLVKVSGNADIIFLPQIDDALQSSKDYVRKYNYIKSDSKLGTPLFLEVGFSPSAVKQLLTEVKQPIWSMRRPLSLMWLVVRDEDGKKSILNDSDHLVVQAMKDDAEYRGIPLIFPALDLKDLHHVTAQDVWLPVMTVLKQASKRYSPDDLLIVRIDMSNKKKMVARWLLFLQEERMQWETEGDDIRVIVRAGVDNVAHLLSKRFAKVEKVLQTQDVFLKVENLDEITDYAKVFRYLKGLMHVSKVEVLNVSPIEASFMLTFAGDVGVLKREISLSPLLRFEYQDKALEQNSPVLQYKYNQMV